MKKRKIIHIQGPSSPFSNRENDVTVDSYDYLTWPWFSHVAFNTLKCTDKYEIECWRPEKDVPKIFTREIDGVTFKVFPCLCLNGMRVVRTSLIALSSLSMLKALKKEAKNNEVLIHLHGVHNPTTYLTSYLFRNLPIVVQHHGDMPALLAFKWRKNPLSLLAYFIEKITLNNIDHFFVPSKGEKELLSHIVEPNKISIQSMGIDFERFKPLNKIEARRKLDLPLNHKIMLHVGRYGKGIDGALKTFQILKKKYDVELVWVDSIPGQPLHNEAKEMGARVCGFIPLETLIHYYNAADVYLFPSFERRLLKVGGGIGVATIESLACGVPTVATALKHFPTDEWRKVGKIPKDEDDVVRCVSEIFEDPTPYKDCREVAKKYYSWGAIITNTIKIYDELFDKYY